MNQFAIDKEKGKIRVTDLPTIFTKLEEILVLELDPFREYITNKFSLSKSNLQNEYYIQAKQSVV